MLDLLIVMLRNTKDDILRMPWAKQHWSPLSLIGITGISTWVVKKFYNHYLNVVHLSYGVHKGTSSIVYQFVQHSSLLH